MPCVCEKCVCVCVCLVFVSVDDTDGWSCFFSGKSVKSLWTSCPRTAPRSVPVDPPPAWSRASREASPTSACSPTASVHPPSARRSPPSRATWWRRSNCWTKERVEGRATTTRRWSTANRGRGTHVWMNAWMDGWEAEGKRKEGEKTWLTPSASLPLPSGYKLRLLPPRNLYSPSPLTEEAGLMMISVL